MTSLLWKSVEWFDEFEKHADPRVRNWFLMGSPISPFVILISYLFFVQKLGPWLMKNRTPLKIEKIIILYNAVQVYMAVYIVKEACRVLWFTGGYNFHCIEIDYSDTEHGREQARTVWVYLMTKLLDLLDTVFFVLRKKQSQVTFLHVYHHTLVFSFAWFVTKYYPGGQIAFFGTVNAFVHMIMYTYYLITALHLVNSKSLWWKKYITQLQLYKPYYSIKIYIFGVSLFMIYVALSWIIYSVFGSLSTFLKGSSLALTIEKIQIQFIITGLHAMLGLFATNCNFPKYLIAVGIPQDVFMFSLFWDFYRKTYMSSKKVTNKLNNKKKLY